MESSPFFEGLPDSETAFGHVVTSHVKLLLYMLLDFPPTGKGFRAEKVLIPLTRDVAPRFQASFAGAVRMMNKMRRPAVAVAIPASR